MNKILLIATHTIHFGIFLEHVVRIVPLAQMREIPKAPPWFIGLLELAGKGVPVMDLKLRLGLGQPSPYLLTTPMVVITWKGKQAGLIVEDLPGVCEIIQGDLMQTELFTHDGPPFLGVARTEANGCILVLDPARLLEIQLGEEETFSQEAMSQLIASLPLLT
ncbi:MAG: chemotaxis protein CheW [Magnetococcales bacterium]|nr:chemotaxis protein CheW [Magnetococcales bacterium]